MTEEQFTKIARLHHSITDAEYKLKAFTSQSWIVSIQKFDSHNYFDLEQGDKNDILELIKSSLVKKLDDLKAEKDRILTDFNQA